MSVELIEHRLTAVESALEKVADAIQEIAASTRLIAHLELKHAETRDSLERAFGEIKDLQGVDVMLDTRMRVVELDMPALNATRRTVDNAIFSVVGLVGLAVIGLVLVR